MTQQRYNNVDDNRPEAVWGSKALHQESCVYVSNKGEFDVEAALEFAGAKARVPMVYCHEGNLSRDVVDTAEESIADKLRFFNPAVDVLMISGRALVNLLVGAVMQDLYPGRSIDILTWNARSREYGLSKWHISQSSAES